MKRFCLGVMIGCFAIITAGCGHKTDTTELVPFDQVSNAEISTTAATPEGTSYGSQMAAATGPVADPSAIPGAGVDAAALENPTNQQIQQALQNAGLYSGAIDGAIGQKSKRAIREFQEQNGLEADGKVGKKTWAKLAPYLNQPAQPAAQAAPDSGESSY